MSKKRAHGELRASQVLMGYGPGAMIDLPRIAIMVGGLEHWKGEQVEIVEPRLQEKVDRFLGTNGIALKAPPVETDSDPKKRSGIICFRFPGWFIALQDLPPHTPGTRSRPLVPIRELRGGEYFAPDKSTHKVVPIRWVQACPGGHCGDIDWDGFVHEFRKRCNRPLYLDELGTSGDLTEIEVRCECGERRSVAAATKIADRPLGSCSGKRPWIGPDSHEKCTEPARLLVRTATDTYFSQTLSVISIPDPDERLRDAVAAVWDFLEYGVETVQDVSRERRKPKVRAALDGFTDAAVFAEVERRRKKAMKSPKGVKEVEAEVFLGSEKEMGEDVHLTSKFFARALADELIDPKLRGQIRRVVLAHRLREVIAQVGFTRFEAETIELDDEELNIGVRRASLADEMRWVPAIENRGEGVFIGFEPDSIEKWLKKNTVKDRGRQLQRGFDAWLARRHNDKARFPGMPYYLLHSISHLLITAVSLDCGYSASSIRERVYAAAPNYGILLYTGTSDAEGTLGGLVEAGRRICSHLASALELGQLCSNDPVCAQHEPDDLHEERFLHGASCHGCLLISETSCERRNEFLDRTLVVPSVAGLGAEYFERP